MIKAAALGFLSPYSFLLPTMSGEAQGKKKSVSDKDCIYSAAREYVQLSLSSDSHHHLPQLLGWTKVGRQ